MKLVIIDYGLSNLLSVKRAFEYCGANPVISSEARDIESADAIVLPGVGAFGDGMKKLEDQGFDSAIKNACTRGIPLLGICLGMQMLFDESSEFGLHKGLGLIEGTVTSIPDTDILGNMQRVPHVGWNHLYYADESRRFDRTILQNICVGEECYFVHGYEAVPKEKSNIIAITHYGGRNICAAVKKNNIYGTQFHPEKSGEVGMKIIRSFLDSVI